MTDLRIGSQEWRRNKIVNEGLWLDGGFMVLSTRCGITAPGHSAGVVRKSGRIWTMGPHRQYHDSRAEAAAAAFVAHDRARVEAMWRQVDADD